MKAPYRTAHVVLTSPAGEVLGRLPPVVLTDPWWNHVPPLVEAVRARHGVEIVVLRILAVGRPLPPGGDVTYLAETPRSLRCEPWPHPLPEHPLRTNFARPGGPRGDLDWARSALREAGLVADGRPEQIKTWALSSLWRLPTTDGAAWLKVVPSFFAHEPALLARLAAHGAPGVLAAEGPRLLMRGVPGGHVRAPAASAFGAMVEALVRLQVDWIGRCDELLSIGVPTWRVDQATGDVATAIERVSIRFGREDRALLRRFVADLPRRFERLDSCGFEPTLVHGDFHPGNFLGDAREPAMIDFGDSLVGHPLLDLRPFLDRVGAKARAHVRRRWMALWRRALPGSDPECAARLIEPIAAARQAIVYLRFLDMVEPAEHPYHAHRPELWLRRAIQALRLEPRSKQIP